MRISDWSSDGSSDLWKELLSNRPYVLLCLAAGLQMVLLMGIPQWFPAYMERSYGIERVQVGRMIASTNTLGMLLGIFAAGPLADRLAVRNVLWPARIMLLARSEENTSELQSLMRISYAVFCLITKIEYLIT